MTVEIEFSSGTWTDVTGDARLPIVIRQGRRTPYDDIAPGSISLVLNNPDGDYTPTNTGSTYYPNVVKNKRIRFSVTKSSTTYVRFVGRIQRWRAVWPSSDYRKGRVEIQAVDDLGLLGQRKLLSNFTETVLWRAREDSVVCDVYEASGSATGVQAYLTNYSEDSSPGAPTIAYSGTFPSLRFEEDQDLSCGQVVRSNPGNGGQSNKTLCGFQSNPLQIILHFRCPADLADSTLYTLCSFQNSTPATTFNLIYTVNGSDNGLFVMDATNTTNLGIVANLPRDQWVKLRISQNGTTATHLDVTCTREDGTANSNVDVNRDVRDVARIEIPGAIGSMAAGSWGGICAIGASTNINLETSFVGGSGHTWVGRVTAVADMCDQMPVTIGTVGSPTSASLLTGRTSGRTAAAVLAEIARSDGGLVWARPRDSAVYAIASGLVRPSSPIATIDVEDDCVGPPILEDATDTQPTRVDVTWPGGTVQVIDSTLEASGDQRKITVDTVCASAAAAQTVGENLLEYRSAGLRFARVVVDLSGGSTDHTSAFFTTASTLEGLYPSVRVRLSLPTALLGSSTVDVHVQGWEERYEDGGVTVALDTSPST